VIGLSVGGAVLLVALVVVALLWRRRKQERHASSEFNYDIEMPVKEGDLVSSDSDWDGALGSLAAVGESLWSERQSDQAADALRTFHAEEGFI
jgi:hypothetical protein